MSGLPMAGTPVKSPKDVLKYDLYINEGQIYELSTTTC